MSTLFMSWQLSVLFFPVDSITVASWAAATKIIYAFPPLISADPQFYGLIRCNRHQQAGQSVEASGQFLDRTRSFKPGVSKEELWQCICRAINQHKWAVSLCQQRVGCAAGFLLSSMQIGEDGGLKAFKCTLCLNFLGFWRAFQPADGATPNSRCFPERKGKQCSFLCAATGPPATSSTSAAHPKLAGASTAPRLSMAKTASPALFSRNNCVQTQAPTPHFLLWISSGITLHHPPPPFTARKGREQLPRQYRRRKQNPFVPTAPSQRRLRYMIYPSPSSTPKASKHSQICIPHSLPLQFIFREFRECPLSAHL